MFGREVAASANNLLRAMRFFGSARKTGEIQDLPGISIVSCGLNYAAFNAALLSEPLDSLDELRRRIQIPARHFHSRNLRWTYWLCNDYLNDAARAESRRTFNSFGLSVLTEPPGMFADRLLPPARRLPQIRVRRVDDDATRQAFAHITATSFDIPEKTCMEIYAAAPAWAGDFHGYVGYVDKQPVTTTATVVAANVVGIYSVGTLPRHRSLGYAEALMRHALSIEREATGIEETVLQSTHSGLRLYQRMGYRKITSFTVYIS